MTYESLGPLQPVQPFEGANQMFHKKQPFSNLFPRDVVWVGKPSFTAGVVSGCPRGQVDRAIDLLAEVVIAGHKQAQWFGLQVGES